MTAQCYAIPSAVIEALQNGRLIEAIKEWRTFTGWGLKEAKDFIEQNCYNILSGIAIPRPNEEPPRSGSTPTHENGASPPRQELLLKMLNMTTAENDGQALVAIRKANSLLASAGWTWEKLLAGKIVIVEDPFASIATPQQKDPERERSRAPATPARPTPAPRPPKGVYSYSSTPIRQPAPSWPGAPFPSPTQAAAPSITCLGTQTNRYANHCYCCGTEVDQHAGFIFNPSNYTPKAYNGWAVSCKSCNTSVKTIQLTRAKKIFAPHQASSHVDLSNL